MKNKRIFTFLFSVVLYSLIWIGFHGVPNPYAPKAKDISYITVASENEEIKIENSKDIEILANCINLTNHTLFGKAEGSPHIAINYHLKNGTMFILSLNQTSVWRNNSSYKLKDQGIAYNIIKSLYLDKTE